MCRIRRGPGRRVADYAGGLLRTLRQMALDGFQPPHAARSKPLPQAVDQCRTLFRAGHGFGIGNQLEGRIYDMANPAEPLVIATATDDAYTQGMSGLVVFSATNERASGGFDNFSVSDGTKPVPDVAVENNVVSVSWPVAAGLAHGLYSSGDLVEWIRVTDLVYGEVRAAHTEPLLPDAAPKFFRLQLGP